jgi:hypothetical protein
LDPRSISNCSTQLREGVASQHTPEWLVEDVGMNLAFSAANTLEIGIV